MPAVGFVVPLLPGQTEADRTAIASCWHGERTAAYEDSRRRAGVTREATWIQSTPAGEVVVVYLEADDLARSFEVIGTSDEPFDRWFREHVLQAHGVRLEDGIPLPEQILDFQVDRTASQAR